MLQHPLEFAELLELYRERRPRRVLELGVHLGGTLYQWLRAAPKGATVVAVDDVHRCRSLYCDWAPAGVELVVIVGSSGEVHTVERAARHAPYEWVFVDADHHELEVRRDVELYGELVAPGGVLVLHDVTPSADPTIEVDRLWAELELELETRVIEHEGGFGIGVVYRPSNGAAARAGAAVFSGGDAG